MSCNGCRVLRKGCSEDCELRSCLQWIKSPEAQGHATMFAAKFFGRAGLKAFISNVPDSQRAGLFMSLLFEACGRTINPVSGAVGLLGSGNWSLCQAAVDTVLRGGTLRFLSEINDGLLVSSSSFSARITCHLDLCLSSQSVGGVRGEDNTLRRLEGTLSMSSEESIQTSAASGGGQPRLLNLFV